MKKIISFSLYGSYPKYTIGMIRNVELAKKYYPGWRVYLFFDETVPKNILDQLSKFDNVDFINISITPFAGFPKMFWRFIPYEFSGTFDIIYIVRDSDSRISPREVAAVNEWLESDKSLHIMRDHPHHDHRILGGMWGIKYNRKYNFTEKIISFLKTYQGGPVDRMTDMNWLSLYVYNDFINDSICHDNFFKYPNNRHFPVDREGCEFVGEIFDENDVPAFQRGILEDYLRILPEEKIIKSPSNPNPKVSVIIPTFNRIGLLNNAIESIKKQTYKNIEIVVVDDCSTEVGYSELSKLQSDNFKYFRMPVNKKNPCDARNKGLELFTGDYVCFLDDDDTFLPYKIEKQLQIMQEKESLFSCTEAYYSDRDSVFIPGNTYPLYFHQKFIDFIRNKTGLPKLPEYINKKFNTGHNYLMTSSVMIHRSIIQKAGVFVYKGVNGIWEDWAYWLRCMDFTDCLYIDIPLTFYNDSVKPNFIYRPV